MSINAIHVHVEEGGKHGKIKGNIVLKHMIAEWCMKVGVMLSPLTLNRQPLEREEMWGCCLAPSY